LLRDGKNRFTNKRNEKLIKTERLSLINNNFATTTKSASTIMMKMTIKALSFLFFVALTIATASAHLCPICHDGSYPRYDDALLFIYPGYLPQSQYTCKELYYLGNYPGAIDDSICDALVIIAANPCGCDGLQFETDEPVQWDTSSITSVESPRFNFIPNNLTAPSSPTPRVSAPLKNLTQSSFHKGFFTLAPVASPTQSQGTNAPSIDDSLDPQMDLQPVPLDEQDFNQYGKKPKNGKLRGM
jgi:hypothetical protein